MRVDETVVAASRASELELRMHELEHLLSHKTLEVEVLREALQAARGKRPS